MAQQTTPFQEMWGKWQLYGFVAAAESEDLFRELRTIHRADEQGDGQFLRETLENPEKDELLRVYAARCRTIRSFGPESRMVEVMGNILLRERDRPYLRAAAAEALYGIDEAEAARRLINALVQVEEPALKALIAHAVHHHPALPWQNKLERLLQAVAAEKLAREHLDLPALLYAIRPPFELLKQDRYLLADYLVSQAAGYHQDELMTGVLAGFLIESTGRNLDRANRRVRLYLYGRPDDEAKLKGLLAEMNSQLTPAELEMRLETTFHEPLRQMNREIHKMWRKAIRQAQWGVNGRLGLGVALFLAGLLFLVASLAALFNGAAWPEARAGGVVALALLLMATLLYSSAVRHGRQMLADVGIANAVYAAYAQRTLAISNAFGRLYLQGKIDPATVKESNDLIGQTLAETVKALRTEKVASIDELLKEMGIE